MQCAGDWRGDSLCPLKETELPRRPCLTLCVPEESWGSPDCVSLGARLKGHDSFSLQSVQPGTSYRAEGSWSPVLASQHCGPCQNVAVLHVI